MTEADLLAGIVAHPGDVDRWLILADWLEEQGDPRAELARLRFLLHTEPEHPVRAQRQVRQLELLEAGLAPVVPAWTNSLGIEFALILPGSFWMGSPVEESQRYDNEQRHRVTLTHPFSLGVYPVTVGQFDRFVTATGYKTEAEKGGGAYGYAGRHNWTRDTSINWRSPGFPQTEYHPVVCVSWNDAQAMVAWLNQADPAALSLAYTLPTEAQWEHACRAGAETAFWWGEDASLLGGFAWVRGNSEQTTHRVQTKKPNPWGLWHTHGHVWEWCTDWYGDYSDSAEQDPLGASRGSQRVCRGGSWLDGASCCRAAYRGYNSPGERRAHDGFRLAALWQR
jgi:uncharacterized protein (TIGR02996 family)